MTYAPSELRGPLCGVSTLLLINPGRARLMGRIHFVYIHTYHTKQLLLMLPIRPMTRLTALEIRLPRATGQLLPLNPVHIPIAPSLHACGCAYQITPHSAPDVPRCVSDIMRHVLKHSAPPAHVSLRSLTPDNCEADSRRRTCFSRDGGVFCASMTVSICGLHASNTAGGKKRGRMNLYLYGKRPP